ncbi:MAG TPA: hypothetical protein VG674_08080 [Amycolatopsis sp.]|nr:hypothetical protein [Amycolatopsis sp.]
MTIETASEPATPSATPETTGETTGAACEPAQLPTAPCSVVWCSGRPYVLEGRPGRARWAGTDDRGRPETLTRAQLQRRGWTHRRAG